MYKLKVEGKSYIQIDKIKKGSCVGCELNSSTCQWAKDRRACSYIYKEKKSDDRWCVYVTGKNLPKVIHTNYKEAVEECHRLAKLNIGVDVVLYKATEIFKANEPEVMREEL